MPSSRVEQALEQLSEDGTLTGDLDDAAGGALLQWAEQQIIQADAQLDDATFAGRVAAIRSAVRSATRATGRSLDPVAPETVIAQAAALLNRGGMNTAVAQPSVGTTVAVEADATAPANVSPDVAATAQPENAAAALLGTSRAAHVDVPEGSVSSPLKLHSAWQTLRRRMRRWIHRKV